MQVSRLLMDRVQAEDLDSVAFALAERKSKWPSETIEKAIALAVKLSNKVIVRMLLGYYTEEVDSRMATCIVFDAAMSQHERLDLVSDYLPLVDINAPARPMFPGSAYASLNTSNALRWAFKASCKAMHYGTAVLLWKVIGNTFETRDKNELCAQLERACTWTFTEMVEFLVLKVGVPVTLSTLKACINGTSKPRSTPILRLMVPVYIDSTEEGSKDVLQRAMKSACLRGNLCALRYLLHEQNIPPTTAALFAACAQQSQACVKELIDSGLDVSMGNPLDHVGATREGRFEILDMLIKAGANINMPDHVFLDSSTQLQPCLYVSSHYGNADEVQLLLNAGANPNIVIVKKCNMVAGIRTSTPLQLQMNTIVSYADDPTSPTCERAVRIARMLLQAGADPHSPGLTLSQQLQLPGVDTSAIPEDMRDVLFT